MIFILLYQCLAGFLAWWNYTLIKNQRKIYHFLNGAIHLTAACLIGYFTKWNYGVSCLLFTRVVFDTVLNILRNKGVGYVSPFPASVVDQIEKKIILWLASKVHKKRTFIRDEDVQWVAIGFRLFVLISAIIILFI